MRYVPFLLAGLASAMAHAGPALAEGPQAPAAGASPCLTDYKEMARRLETGFAEVLVSAGVDEAGRMVSVFVAATSGTWTIVVTRPAGPSCIVAAGRAWHTLPAAAEPRA
jgi:hypothetical protein